MPRAYRANINDYALFARQRWGLLVGVYSRVAIARPPFSRYLLYLLNVFLIRLGSMPDRRCAIAYIHAYIWVYK